FIFFFSSRRRHTRWPRDWSSDVCSSDLSACAGTAAAVVLHQLAAAAEQSRGAAGVSVAAGPAGLAAALCGSAGDLALAAADQLEIGRASCRERVEDLGVGGSYIK